MTPHPSPRLLADIDGTHARFTLETAPGVFADTACLRRAVHADFYAAVNAYLSGLTPGLAARVEHAAVAIARSVEGDDARMTNGAWHFSSEDMRQRLGLSTLMVVNDLTALAMALPQLDDVQRRAVGGGRPREHGVPGVLGVLGVLGFPGDTGDTGAGTSLAVSGLIPVGSATDSGYGVLGIEGGHTSFAPRDEREIAILRHGLKRIPHVSFEHLLSGPGLVLIHEALLERAGLPPLPRTAPEIMRLALAGADAVCAEALQAFCAVLGTAAANLAVALGAWGGIYIGGGIVRQLGGYFDRSPFRARFEDQGGLSNDLRGIPTYVVTAEHAIFLGASAILGARLRTRQAGHGAAILVQIQRSRDGLSPAERRVADHVLAHPRSTLSDPIAAIAKASQVSQPTVIRFCRSLGCEGLSDFKLRLASGLSAAIPLTHTQVTNTDSVLELSVKVLGNTASAILQMRDHLNRDSLAMATDMLAAAQRIDFFATGHDAVAADDAQFKFLRLAVPSSSYTDARLQLLAAQVLRPGDVVVIVSSSGRVDELLAVADLASARGVPVVAITASHSPLAKKADVVLIVDHVENVAAHVPMVSRILHLLVIDTLAVGVAMRPSPGIRAVELLRLSSHSS